jgi:hypothetical protein
MPSKPTKSNQYSPSYACETFQDEIKIKQRIFALFILMRNREGAIPE